MTKDEICGLLRQIHDVLAMQSETNQVKPVTENGLYRLGYHNGYGFGEAYGKANAPQRTWVGLTDEDVTWLCNTGRTHEQTWGMFVRTIEAKLKEKNNV